MAGSKSDTVRSAGSNESKGCFRTFLDVILVIATVLSTLIAWAEHQDKRKVEVDLEKIRKRLETVEAQLKSSEVTISEQRKELETNLSTFAQHYRTKVKKVATTISDYRAFDTPVNRKELGRGFEKRKAEKFEALKTQVSALVDFVKQWRSVLEALRQLLDGRIDALDQEIAAGNEATILRQFTIIQENLDSDIDRLIKSLEAAVKH